MSKEKYYQSFGLSGVPKSDLKNEELANLYALPKKEKITPRVDTWVEDAVLQADLLEMPDDEGYRYILMVVELAVPKIDAEPLKSKSASTVLKAFKAIFKRNFINAPTARLEVDDGGEFKAEVQKYFVEKLKVLVKYGQPGRHRQQTLVERANGLIGGALYQRMSAQELLTGEPSREWVKDLPKMLQALRNRWKYKPRKRPEGPPKVDQNTVLLAEGTKVRVALDGPRGVIGEKLHGTFRASDIRWDPEIRTIVQCVLRPEQPPMYLISGTHGKLGVMRAAYTRNRLQVVPENENAPPPSVIRGKPKHYIAEKIIQSRTRKGQRQFLIKWKGFPEKDATWEPAENLPSKIVQGLPTSAGSRVQ